MNKSHLLSMLLASSIMLSPTPSQAIDYKQAALIAGATLGTAILGKVAYDYFFALSDLEEIEYALGLCQKATQVTNNIAFAYHKEIAITDPIKRRHHNQWHSDKVLHKLRLIITSKAVRHPYYSYVKQLDTNISTLAYQEAQLADTKIRLFERKMRLMNKPSKELSAVEIASLCKEYDKALQCTEQVMTDAQEVHSALFEIRTYVINTQEYQYEAAMVRIEELEKALQREKWHQNHMDRIDTHHTYVHVHTTTQPIQYVQQQEPTKCCPAPTPDCASTVECAQPCQTTCPPCVPPKKAAECNNNTQEISATPSVDERVQTYTEWRDQVMYVGG